MKPNLRLSASGAGIVILLLAAVAAPGCTSGSSSRGKPRPQAQQPLTVMSSSPVNGAVDVARDAAVSVAFSADIDFSSVSAQSFEVKGSSSGPRTGIYAYSGASRTVTFTPSGPHDYAETVEVKVTSAVRSASQVALEAASFSFKVVDEPVVNPPPPVPDLEVAESGPRPHSSDVPRDSVISILFHEPLDASTVDQESIRVTGSFEGRLETTVEPLSEGNRRISARAARTFLAGEQVLVQVSPGLKSEEGGSFAGSAFYFRTHSAAPPRERNRERVFTALGRVSHLLCADFNSDRRGDIVYASENETVIDILLGNGDGTFLPVLRIDVGQTVLSLTVADADLDGDPDILVGTADRARVYWNRSVEEGSPVDLMPFEVGPESPTGSAVRGIAMGDLDHAGAPDVVLDTDRGLEVRLGGLGSPPSQVIGTNRQARTNIVLADLDLDGHLDLVFGDRHGNRVTYYISTLPMAGAASSLFGEALHVDLGTDAEQIAVEDISGEGPPEILVLTVDGASTGGAAFRVLTRTAGAYTVEGGGGGVGAGEDNPVEATLDTGRFTMADVDGNGFPDILLAALDLGKVLLFRNEDGRLNLEESVEVLSTPEAWLVEVVDLDDDGSVDILAAGKSEIHALLPGDPDPPPPPEGKFELSIDAAQVRQKDTGASALVRVTNAKPLQGYSLAVGYDALAVLPTGVSLEGTLTAAAAPEFVDFQLHEAESAAVYSVLIDMLPPIEGRTIPTGENELLVRFVYDVLETAPLGTTSFAFASGVGSPPLSNQFVVESQSVEPETTPGALTVLPPAEPPPPKSPNRMELTVVDVEPGAEGSLPVLGSAERAVEAFTSLVAFDPSLLEVTSLDLAGSASEALAPELVVPSILNEEGYIAFTVIFDFLPPFAQQTLPPGEDMLLFTIRFNARAGVAPGAYPVRFQNQLGDPPLNNIFVFESQSFFPELIHGEVRVGGVAAPTFVRGDFDGSLSTSITDAVLILAHLFQGGAEPPCADAADANDGGTIDLTDALHILDHLFRGGPAPPAPYPNPGVDPTADALGCDR
ncbi:MAG TPA: FG-GAP-like repeat-containing protein [Planctomycetota bacterium]|nr:FG-GAP-like repeat-containing protein [Planctomycetota bacterium]